MTVSVVASVSSSLNQKLLVQSQQWKQQNNAWNMFQINNKDISNASMTSFGFFYC